MAKINTKEMKTSTEEVGQVLMLMEKVKAFIDKHGLKGSFTTLLMLFMVSMIGYYSLNPGAVIETIEKVQAEKHNDAIKARLDADPKIRSYLIEMRSELHADRVYILETHNGGMNLTNLPFVYVDLTYAEPKTALTWLEMEYKNLRLSRYPWAAYVFQKGYWFGSVSDVETEDPELFLRLKAEEVNSMGMIMIYGQDSMPSGTLGVVYTDDSNIPPKEVVVRVMEKYMSLISPLLCRH